MRRTTTGTGRGSETGRDVVVATEFAGGLPCEILVGVVITLRTRVGASSISRLALYYRVSIENERCVLDTRKNIQGRKTPQKITSCLEGGRC